MPATDVIESDNIQDHSPTPTSAGLGSDTKTGFNRNGTDAPKIGENETENETELYAKSTAELIDKRVFSGKGIPFVVILIIMGLIFAQDNYTKALKSWNDIWWSIQKCSFFLFLYIAFLLHQFISWLWKVKK